MSTLWEVGQMVEASLWRAQQNQKRSLHQAWHIAVLANNAFVGKLPRLETLIREPKAPRASAQTQAMQIAVWQAMDEKTKARD